jgi:hypothetical protein
MSATAASALGAGGGGTTFIRIGTP